MNVEVSIELERTSLVWPESTRAHIELINNSSETLSRINSGNVKGAATVLLTDVRTGEATRHSLLRQPDVEGPPLLLKPSETLQEVVTLSRLFGFPSCGVFDLRAHYEYAEGEIESESALVEVVSAQPQSMAIATIRGSNVGNIFCAWLNRSGNQHQLWLTFIHTFWETRFAWSKELCIVDEHVVPVVSIPANTIPTQQLVAWISDRTLNYGIPTDEGFDLRSFELDFDDYKFASQPLEDEYVEGVRQDFEALLLRPNETGWHLRVVRLDDSPRFIGSPLIVEGSVPSWFQTVYRSDGTRQTFFLIPYTTTEGIPAVAFALSAWAQGKTPVKPIVLRTWHGNVVAADVVLASNDQVFGAVVTNDAVKNDELAVHRWHLDIDQEFRKVSETVERWEKDWKISFSRLRVNSRGEAFLLIRGGAQNAWFFVDEHREMTRIADSDGNFQEPADIFFVDQAYPAILYTDPRCGLKIDYRGPIRVYRPPR